MSDPYFQAPGLSFHQLRDFARVSPSYFFRRHISGELAGPDSAAMRLGRLIHLAVLEPEKATRIATVPAEHLTPSGGLSKKAATDAWLATLPTRDYATPDELALCKRIADAVRGNVHARALVLAADAQIETEVFGELPVIGAVKAKIDLRTGGAVYDLKTCADLDKIAGHIADFDYVEQLTWYADRCNERVGGLIAVEKDEPHRVAVIQFADDAIAAARARIASWLARFAECRRDGLWPNDPPKPITISAADLAR